MKTLITGAGGFLGRGMVEAFDGRHDLRLMDVVDFDTPHEKLVADVADLDACRAAVDGCDAAVIAHMASRQAGAYDRGPGLPFDANVKGTANLFFAGMEAGIRRFVLISSESVIKGHPPRRTVDLPYRGETLYGLTKVCQEVIAEQLQREHGLEVAALRVGYILSAEDREHVVDKYGKHIRERNAPCTDRRDIGEAARLAAELEGLTYEVFYVMGAPEADTVYEMAPTFDRLGWRPRHDFTWLPGPK